MKHVLGFLLLIIATLSYGEEFLQADRYYDQSNTVVGSLEFDPIAISGAYVDWDGGSLKTMSVGYVLNLGIKTIIGPNMMYIDKSFKYGANISIEKFHMFGKQSLYWLASYKSTDKSWNVVLQYSPIYKHSLELTLGATDVDSYHYQIIAYSYKLTKILNLRAGYRINDHTFFGGFSINTF